ncbi:MAG: methyltransferase domain-containing protein [Selenomonadaceae bacterium]|nr:methyltransferase domain-containing protein [Selenomonadaceae bacterium]
MERKTDVITGETVELESLYVFKDFPVNMLVDAAFSPENDALFDMSIGISANSGCIQLMETLPEEMIYVDKHFNAIGGMWNRQHQTLANLIGKQNDEKILEIGGGTGILERVYNSYKKNPVKWTIIDPCPNPLNTNAKFIKGYFPASYDPSIEFDTVVHSHVLEHSYSPCDFIKSVCDILKQGQRMVFSVPNFDALLSECATSIINFEHTICLAEEYVDFLLAKFGFVINEKIHFENHSVIYDTMWTGQPKSTNSLGGLYEKNKKLFKNYIDKHLSQVKKLNYLLEHKERKVFLFGAHIASQFYLAFGLHSDKIEMLLDNDKSKWGKRLGGSHLLVASPDVLQTFSMPTVILPLSPYSDEIKANLTDKLDGNIQFIEMKALQ